MQPVDVAIVGGGAAGLMAAIWAGRTTPGASIVCLDGAERLGAKILIAGGGRCNVTHDVVDERAFAGASPNAVRKVLRRFDVPETVAFFAARGGRRAPPSVARRDDRAFRRAARRRRPGRDDRGAARRAGNRRPERPEDRVRRTRLHARPRPRSLRDDDVPRARAAHAARRTLPARAQRRRRRRDARAAVGDGEAAARALGLASLHAQGALGSGRARHEPTLARSDRGGPERAAGRRLAAGPVTREGRRAVARARERRRRAPPARPFAGTSRAGALR